MSDTIYLFYKNKVLKGVFDNEEVMKKKVIKNILTSHVNEDTYKNIDEAKNFLRKKIIGLFDKDFYFMENNNNIWYINKINKNEINDKIEIIEFKTKYTKLNIKGKFLTKKDLYTNLPYL
jgi:hypothetical protein